MSTAPAEIFLVTHDLAFLHSIDTHLIRSGPEIKKKCNGLYINFHDVESNAFWEFMSRIIPTCICPELYQLHHE